MSHRYSTAIEHSGKMHSMEPHGLNSHPMAFAWQRENSAKFKSILQRSANSMASNQQRASLMSRVSNMPAQSLTYNMNPMVNYQQPVPVYSPVARQQYSTFISPPPPAQSPVNNLDFSSFHQNGVHSANTATAHPYQYQADITDSARSHGGMMNSGGAMRYMDSNRNTMMSLSSQEMKQQMYGKNYAAAMLNSGVAKQQAIIRTIARMTPTMNTEPLNSVATQHPMGIAAIADMDNKKNLFNRIYMDSLSVSKYSGNYNMDAGNQVDNSRVARQPTLGSINSVPASVSQQQNTNLMYSMHQVDNMNSMVAKQQLNNENSATAHSGIKSPMNSTHGLEQQHVGVNTDTRTAASQVVNTVTMSELRNGVQGVKREPGGIMEEPTSPDTITQQTISDLETVTPRLRPVNMNTEVPVALPSHPNTSPWNPAEDPVSRKLAATPQPPPNMPLYDSFGRKLVVTPPSDTASTPSDIASPPSDIPLAATPPSDIPLYMYYTKSRVEAMNQEYQRCMQNMNKLGKENKKQTKKNKLNKQTKREKYLGGAIGTNAKSINRESATNNDNGNTSVKEYFDNLKKVIVIDVDDEANANRDSERTARTSVACIGSVHDASSTPEGVSDAKTVMDTREVELPTAGDAAVDAASDDTIDADLDRVLEEVMDMKEEYDAELIPSNVAKLPHDEAIMKILSALKSESDILSIKW